MTQAVSKRSLFSLVLSFRNLPDESICMTEDVWRMSGKCLVIVPNVWGMYIWPSECRLNVWWMYRMSGECIFSPLNVEWNIHSALWKRLELFECLANVWWMYRMSGEWIFVLLNVDWMYIQPCECVWSYLNVCWMSGECLANVWRMSGDCTECLGNVYSALSM